MAVVDPPELRRLRNFWEALPHCPHGCDRNGAYESPSFRVPTPEDTLDDQVSEIIARYEREAPAMLQKHLVEDHQPVLVASNRCPCGHWTGGDYQCLNGRIYGPCGHENCTGVCDDTYGRCSADGCLCEEGRVTDTYVRLSWETVQPISDQLEARGWDPEYVTDSEIKMTFPDPGTGHAMRFSEFWLSWRLIDGRLTYGISDDIGDPWRAQLDVDADATPEAVAAAADRAMHLLWHCDERDALRELHEKYMLLSDMKTRMHELGRRLVVTPGMIRAALKPSGSWTP